MLTLDDLYEDAQRFLSENYDMALTIPIEINDSFLEVAGAFAHSMFGHSLQIEISGYLVEFAEDEIVYDVLHHELVHYALYERQEPFKDGEEHFEAELKRLGIAPTNALQVGVYHAYTCDGCGEKTHAPMYMPEPGQWRTTCCDETFKLVPREKRVYTGKERIY